MWVARVLERLDEYMGRRTCRRGKPVKSKKLLPGTLFGRKWLAFAMRLVAGLFHKANLPCIRFTTERLAVRPAP